MFNQLFKKFSRNIGVDLGTSNTLIYVKDRGIVAREPSIVAINTKTDQIIAIGEEARKMIGRTPPHIVVSRPLVGGVISDFEVAEKMLKYFINKIRQESFGFSFRPKAIVGIPLDLTEVEKKAVEDAVISAGAREVFLVENIIATAIGARLPIQDPSGSMIVDIGGGVTEIAVISLSGVVAYRSLKIAGDEFDQNIIQYARDEINLLIGEGVAERVKIQAGALKETEENPEVESIEIKIRGRDLISGLPREISVRSEEIVQALEYSLKSIVENIKSTLEITPPELVADIYQKGLVLAGGSALLKGIDEIIAQATKIPVRITDDPLTCAVRGMGLILEDENLLKEISVPTTQEEK